MKQILLLLSACFLFIQVSNAQDCQGRYIETIADAVDINTITYSDVSNYEMDVYTPVGDDGTDRPLIIMAHGGSFIGGSKVNPTMVQLCTRFAKLGYVTASIQYSLTDILTLSDSLNMVISVMDAVADGKSAIRWFRKDVAEGENQFDIDPEQIFVLGNSAGAILMAHLAYVSEDDELQDFIANAVAINGGIDGAAGNPGYSSEVSGFINCAGGIYDVNYISADEAPIISFHGDADGVVPFDCNNVFWEDFGDALINLCGSYPITQHSEAIGLRNDLRVFLGANHVPWEGQFYDMDTVFSRAVNFLYPELACNQTQPVGMSEYENYEIELYPNPSKNGFYVKISENSNSDKYIINLHTVLGNRVKTVQTIENELFINRENLPSGVYFMTINGECAKKYKIIFD